MGRTGVFCVKIVAQVKLLPACLQPGRERGVGGGVPYRQGPAECAARGRVLPAQGRVRSRRRTKVESKPVVFREDAAQPYDDRILTWNLDQRTVSIWTLAGRLKGVPFVCSPEAMKLLSSRKGESDLVRRDGMLFLIAVIDVPEPEPLEPDGFLGVDLGIVDIATTSDGQIMSGRQVNRYRQRQRDLRTKVAEEAHQVRQAGAEACPA